MATRLSTWQPGLHYGDQHGFNMMTSMVSIWRLAGSQYGDL